MSGAAARAVMALLLLAAGDTARADAPAPRPPYAGAYEPQGDAERGLWMELDESERALRHSPNVVTDPGLNAMVRRVLCDTVGADRCAALRTYVIHDASFNASMAPNGLTVINTGLLARLHSEAELAGVLGHEFAHFERRHGLAGFLKARASKGLSAWLGLLGTVITVDTRARRQDMALAVIGHGRAQEAEADELGARLIAGSRFRLAEAAVWQRVIDEEDASRRARGLRPMRHDITRPTDDHPAEGQRLAWFAREEARLGPRGEDGAAAYRSATAPVLDRLFAALIHGRDFAVADAVITARGTALGWDGPLLALRAALFGLRGHPRDLVAARDLAQQAIATGAAPAEAWRTLGLVQLKQGDAAGRTTLADYLARAPGAVDAALLRALIGN